MSINKNLIRIDSRPICLYKCFKKSTRINCVNLIINIGPCTVYSSPSSLRRESIHKHTAASHIHTRMNNKSKGKREEILQECVSIRTRKLYNTGSSSSSSSINALYIHNKFEHIISSAPLCMHFLPAPCCCCCTTTILSGLVYNHRNILLCCTHSSQSFRIDGKCI